MGKNKICFFIALVFLSKTSVYSQFYTVWPKKEEKTIIRPDSLTNKDTSNITKDKVEAIEIPEKQLKTLSVLEQRQFLSLPIDNIKITSPYGQRKDPFTKRTKFHKGIDLAANYNYIYSIMPGRVIRAGKNKGLGYYVQIDHGEFKSTYGHLFTCLVNKKDIVSAGQIIGISGNTGRSTGEHLHFQLSYKKKTINPKPILEFIQAISNAARQELEVQKKNTNTTKPNNNKN